MATVADSGVACEKWWITAVREFLSASADQNEADRLVGADKESQRAFAGQNLPLKSSRSCISSYFSQMKRLSQGLCMHTSSRPANSGKRNFVLTAYSYWVVLS